jgi:hypothetical protein
LHLACSFEADQSHTKGRYLEQLVFTDVFIPAGRTVTTEPMRVILSQKEFEADLLNALVQSFVAGILSPFCECSDGKIERWAA